MLFLLGLSFAWAAEPNFLCGGWTALQRRSDEVTQLIYTGNNPRHPAIATDGVAEPKNWYDAHTQIFHYYRAITVEAKPVAVFELNYSLADGGCSLLAVTTL